ncbi:hypothetical protein ACFLYU_02730 [Candidatus Dependentiae bacterium]
MLIFVTYDGIKNSVFDGQVVKPLEQMQQKTLIISFEKERIPHAHITQKLKNKNNIKIITLKRGPFLGRLALIPELFQLKKVLRKYDNYKLIARGPIAGWLCTKAMDTSQCNSFTIQARGLLAKELQYANRYANTYTKPNPKLKHKLKPKIISKLRYFINKLRIWQLRRLEKNVYKNISNTRITRNINNIYIEAVSNALKDYLVTTFGANPTNITIATHDIPETFSKKTVLKWRTQIQKKLQIPKNTKVYCYNGSVKPWQCPEQVIQYFANLLTHIKKQNTCDRRDLFLLILTQNKKEFEKLLQDAGIPTSAYIVKTVDHCDIYKYLAACNYGIIFREKHIVNWVSRPTKVLEYRSVGLEIIHNDTVGFLKQGF